MDLVAQGLSGGIGGCVGRTVAFPFDTLKVKLATSKSGMAPSVTAIVKQTFAEEGIKGFYRGLHFSAFEALVQKAMVVFNFEAIKQAYRAVTGAEPGALALVFCGYLSDLLGVPFCMPLEKLVVQLQAASIEESPSEIIRRALFTWDGLITAVKSGRVYFVLSLKPGIELAIYDRIKRAIIAARPSSGASDELSGGAAFVLGGFARAVATTILYPYSRGKALLQAQLASSALGAVLQILRTEGVLAMYRGLGMELGRGVTQSAVMFFIMEKIRVIIRNLIFRTNAKALR